MVSKPVAPELGLVLEEVTLFWELGSITECFLLVLCLERLFFCFFLQPGDAWILLKGCNRTLRHLKFEGSFEAVLKPEVL